MFLKSVALIFILLCAANGTQDICSVTGIENLNLIHKSEKVILDDHQGVVETFPMLNLDNAFIEDSPYLKAAIDENNIIISTTPEFAEIEDRRDVIPIVVTLVTVCAEQESRLMYILEVKDTNNHAPKFEKDAYYYMFHDVISNTNELNLNEFQDVAAIDVDISNKQITFAMEDNDYVELKDEGLQDVGDLQRFIANLALKQDMVAPFNKTFVITATDSGEPPLRSTANISIIVLRSEAPAFTKSLYEAYVKKDRDIVMKDGEIALENVTVFDDIRFDIGEGYENFFKLDIADTIKLKLSENRDPAGLVSEHNPTLNISIYAEGDDPSIYAETSVLINMEELFDNVEPTEDAVISNEDGIDSSEGTPNSEEDTTDSNDDTTNLTDLTNDSTENTDVTKEDIIVTQQPEESTTTTAAELGPAYVYTELRGLKYWLNVNRTYVIMFSVLTGCGVLIFLCIAVRGSNRRIR